MDIDLALPLAIVDLINAEDQGVADAVATQREPIAASIALIEAAFRAGDASLARALTAERRLAKPARPASEALFKRARALPAPA